METYQDKLNRAEGIIKSARDYVAHLFSEEMADLDDYYEEIDKLELIEQDDLLYKARLDILLENY